MYITEFEWDEGNAGKNLAHNVEDAEAEEAFFNRTKLRRSGDRYFLYGETDAGRRLFIVFVWTGPGRARVISAREMTRAERRYYERK